MGDVVRQGGGPFQPAAEPQRTTSSVEEAEKAAREGRRVAVVEEAEKAAGARRVRETRCGGLPRSL